jgi:hypothetical protein
MKKAAEFYVRNIKYFGALYCAVPAIAYIILAVTTVQR